MSNFHFTTYTGLKAPCHNCPNREVGCRELCQAWQKYQALKDAEEANKKLKFLGCI